MKHTEPVATRDKERTRRAILGGGPSESHTGGLFESAAEQVRPARSAVRQAGVDLREGKESMPSRRRPPIMAGTIDSNEASPRCARRGCLRSKQSVPHTVKLLVRLEWFVHKSAGLPGLSVRDPDRVRSQI